jgi:glycosyltransferase involved in cell wall biosynthesis
MAGLNEVRGGKRTRGEVPAEKPLVSIVTVVWNGAATLERTIQSVLAQKGPEVEYLVVDGGSTDGTLDLLRRYDDRIDLWVSAKDKGIYDAMNKGIALCNGEWVGLINADDWYEPDAIQQVLAAVKHTPEVNVVHGDIWIHYPNGTKKRKRARNSGFLLKYWEMVLNHPSFFVRRNFYQGRAFDPALRVSGDHHWTLRAWMEDHRQFRYLPIIIANFSAGGASMTNPLKKVLREGDKVSRDLGLGPVERLVGAMVKTALYVPQWAKLQFNQFVSPLIKK